MTGSTEQGDGKRHKDRFVRRTLVVAGIFLLSLLLIFVVKNTIAVLLVAFNGILFAVFLHGLASAVQSHIRLPYAVSFVLVTILIATVIVFGFWLLEPRIAAQLGQLTEQFPRLEARLKGLLQEHPGIRDFVAQLHLQPQAAVRVIAGAVPDVFTTTTGLVAGGLTVLFIAIYMGLNPSLYVHGILYLVPPASQPRAEAVLHHVAYVLWRWVLGRMIGMTFVGILTGMGLYSLGVPMAFILGLFAAILDFVPNIGPVVGAIPAILFALLQDPWSALYVVLLYTLVQFIEGNLLLPMIEQRAVFVPPALTLIVQLMMYFLFGLLGLVLAIPLFAAIAETVKMLYVEDALGRKLELEEAERFEE